MKKQLTQSVAVLTAVLDDESIHAAVMQAGKLIAERHEGRTQADGLRQWGSAADSQHLAAEFVSR